MYIEELKGGEEAEVVVESGEEETLNSCGQNVFLPVGSKIKRGTIVVSGTKRVLVGAGARALFYPTLLYNVVRNKFQAEFRWWDRVGEFLLLGAVPFPVDVPRLKGLGVGGVVTLNEPYETLVPTSLYHANGIDHLVIPTRDYCFAPSLSDISQAVDFIHENTLSRQTTYVHCKAGRGRSTTIVICYLVHHKQMTPDDAYDYVKSIRPRVLLASAQWQAVLEYYHLRVNKACVYRHVADHVLRAPRSMTAQELVAFDDSSVVIVTESDLDGYDSSLVSSDVGSEIWADLSVVYRVRVAGQAALARISCMWFRCHTQQKIPGNKLGRVSSCSISADHLGGISVDIHVY
ncbi:hypothetical protein Patl1_18430 [Pistacia atlantica]|uniref:Uncharacterized protein n=1 Tax=Pistacia atlantica TaxID=434234 RepID=A0ACC1C3X8_9ROSI|nr:hypothetical protein Patl1_18430 [Pistacia atlantica]